MKTRSKNLDIVRKLPEAIKTYDGDWVSIQQNVFPNVTTKRLQCLAQKRGWYKPRPFKWSELETNVMQMAIDAGWKYRQIHAELFPYITLSVVENKFYLMRKPVSRLTKWTQAETNLLQRELRAGTPVRTIQERYFPTKSVNAIHMKINRLKPKTTFDDTLTSGTDDIESLFGIEHTKEFV